MYTKKPETRSGRERKRSAQGHFDRVCKAAERGFRLSHAVLKHMKQVARLESEYGRAVLSETRDDQKLFQTSNGTVGFAWLLMFSTSVTVAQERVAVAQQIKDEVCGVLAAALDMLAAELKQAQAEGMKRFEAQNA